MDQTGNTLPGFGDMVAYIAQDSAKLNSDTEDFVIDRLFYDLSKRTADMLCAADNFRELNGLPRIYEPAIAALGRD